MGISNAKCYTLSRFLEPISSAVSDNARRRFTTNCTNLIRRPFASACLAKHQDLIVGETAKTTYSGSYADPDDFPWNPTT